MDAVDVLIRVAAVIGVGLIVPFFAYGIPAIRRALKRRHVGSRQASTTDDQMARG